MATYLYRARVIAAAGRVVTLRLQIISAEQPEFDSGRAFALMLLYDPIRRGDAENAPLALQVRPEHLADLDWLDAHLEEYIDDAVIIEKGNVPVVADLQKMKPRERTRFFASADAPFARLAIEVTRPEWCAHIRAGMQWDSTAYDPYVA